MIPELFAHHSRLAIQAILLSAAALMALSSWGRHRSVIRAAGAGLVGYFLLPVLAIALVFAMLGGAASSYRPHHSYRW